MIDAISPSGNTNILVTGGAGYIGSHACKMLKRFGFTPVTLDNLSTGWRDAVQFGPLEVADLRVREDLDRIFKYYKPIAVMHFAAMSLVGESIEKPDLYWENNAYGSLNLIRAAVDNKCLNFIFSSTCATYGEHDGLLIDEDTAQLPINPYGKSKKAVEAMLADFEVSHGLKHVIFRYFNVAGASPDGDIGEMHFPETHLIPSILDIIYKKNGNLIIHGTDYDTPDGTCIRDYVHVCDLVDAHVKGLHWLQNGNGSGVFNIGTGVGYSVRQVLQQALEVTECDISIIAGPRRIGDCAKLVSGSTLAQAELGWFAKSSDLKQIISDSWDWYLNCKYRR